MPLISERPKRRTQIDYRPWLLFIGLCVVAVAVAVLGITYDRTYRPAANWGLSALLIAIVLMLFAVDAIPKKRRRR